MCGNCSWPNLALPQSPWALGRIDYPGLFLSMTRTDGYEPEDRQMRRQVPWWMAVIMATVLAALFTAVPFWTLTPSEATTAAVVVFPWTLISFFFAAFPIEEE
jgi:hypothetical protein